MPQRTSPSDDITLAKLLGLLVHRKYVIIGGTILGIILGSLYLRYTPPTYRSDGSLLISETTAMGISSGSSDLGSLLSSSFGIGTGSTVYNEIQVLQSRRFATEVVTSLKSRWEQQPTARAEATRYPLLWRKYPSDASPVGLDTAVVRFSERFRVSRPDKNAELLTLSFDSPSPREAKEVIDLALATYSDLSTRMNRSQAQSALAFLEGERARVDTQLVGAENALLNFMDRSDLVELDAQTELLVQSIASLDAEEEAARVQQSGVTAGISALESALGELMPASTQYALQALTPQLERLQYRLSELETQRVLLLARNPQLAENGEDARLQELDRQIQTLEHEISGLTDELLAMQPRSSGSYGTATALAAQQHGDRLRAQLLELQIEEQRLDATLSVLADRKQAYEETFAALPGGIIELARRKRALSQNEQLYLLISEQYAELSLWEQTQSGLARVVDYGRLPVEPIKPKPLLVMGLVMMLSFFGSVLLVMIKEHYAQEIRDVEKLDQLSVPLLSIIPTLQDETVKQSVDMQGRMLDKGLSMVLNPLGQLAESYRRLQTNVEYSNPDRPISVLLVTSANQGEGKTTVSANLAVALAESGQRVALVDGDFRRPRVHTAFGEAQEPGLTDVLFGGLELDAVIQPTIVPDLCIVPCGRRPPNPGEVMRSARLRQLLRTLADQFDRVIVDSAPYGIISDAGALINLVDGVLVVAKFGDSRFGEVEQTINSLAQINGRTVGTVLTGFDQRISSGYGYYANYRYYSSYQSYAKYSD